MRSWVATIQLSLVSMVFTGCASGPVSLPDPSKNPSASLSTESVSTWTETLAEDYLIPNSEVLIGGQGVTGSFLGLLGVAIDRLRNSSALEGDAKSLAMTFSGTADGMLKKTLEALTGSDKQYRVIDSKSDVKLRTVARFNVWPDKGATLSIDLLANFVDSRTNLETARSYITFSILKLPLNGAAGAWASNGGAKLREEAELGLSSVLYAFVRDLSGAYKYDKDGKPVVILIQTRPTALQQSHRGVSDVQKESLAFLIEEWQQKLIIYAKFRDAPTTRMIAIVPKELLERVGQ